MCILKLTHTNATAAAAAIAAFLRPEKICSLCGFDVLVLVVYVLVCVELGEM